jgi:hypothetical protein
VRSAALETALVETQRGLLCGGWIRLELEPVAAASVAAKRIELLDDVVRSSTDAWCADVAAISCGRDAVRWVDGRKQDVVA